MPLGAIFCILCMYISFYVADIPRSNICSTLADLTPQLALEHVNRPLYCRAQESMALCTLAGQL